MKSANKPKNEIERLALLNDLDILDTIEEQAYDDLTQIAAAICGVPIALVSLVDNERQWFKSHFGLDARETPREFAFCAHAILDNKLFYIPDSTKDERFHDNPLVTGNPNVKFYAGYPLRVKESFNVGTLCVIDNKPRELSEEQKKAICAVGRQVEAQLTLRLKIKELKKLDQMKNEFIAMVSHELRTPLTSIFGSLSFLKSGAFKGNQEKIELLTNTSFENAQRLLGIVNDILDLTKIESGTFELQSKLNNINTVIQKAVAGMEGYFTKCNVAPVLSLDNSIKDSTFDQNRIIQVLNNLLSNSAKFSPDNEKIHIKTYQEGDFLVIAIKDNGPGITKQDQSLLFTKFSKLSKAGKSNVSGTGLGLNISKQLVELHFGKIWLESEVGKGTIFFFSLPK